MGLGFLPALHSRIQCLDLGYGIRDAAADASDSVYVESRTHNELRGLVRIWFAVGNCRADQCERAVNFAVFWWLVTLAILEIPNSGLGADRCRLFGGPC